MTRSPLHRLAVLFAPERGMIALAVVLQFATIAVGVGLMATSAWLVARAAERPSIAALSLAVVGVRAFGISRGVLRYLERLVAHDVTLRLLTRMRLWVYAAIEPLAPARLADRRSGDLAARVVGDVDALEPVYVRLAGPTIAAGLVGLFVFVLMAARDATLAAVAVASLLGGGVAASWIAWRIGRRASAQAVVLRGDLEALVVDGVQGLADLVTFGRTRVHASRVQRTSGMLARAQVRAAGSASLGAVLTALAADLTALLVLALAIVAVRDETLPGVQLALVTLVTLAAFEAIAPLPAAWQALGGAREAARRLFELADTPPAVAADRGASAPPPAHVWEIRDLSFRYPGESAPALEELSLLLSPGRIVAVVGPSGSGKSTLVSLLLRFWDAPPRTILVDGVDARQVDADGLRQRVAAVPQRVHLFTGTLAGNLRLARPEADDDELWTVLRAVGLADLTRGLPDGLDTWIGAQGVNLSGGERQRVALARALLKRAPLLVLDEPTAHLDALAERDILARVRAAAGDRGVLLVTHRLPGLAIADEIVVLRGGRAVERGTWPELSAGSGWFGRMLRTQTASIEALAERLGAESGSA
jgi:ATP-binding cassette, subfamily C, bacterial CydC